MRSKVEPISCYTSRKPAKRKRLKKRFLKGETARERKIGELLVGRRLHRRGICVEITESDSCINNHTHFYNKIKNIIEKGER